MGLPANSRWLLVLGAALLGLAPASAEANEPDGFSKLTRHKQDAIRKYLAVADDALGELPDLISDGGDRSAWDSVCAKAQKSLEDLRAQEVISEELESWFEKQAEAWDNVRSVGGGIADANSDLVTSLDRLNSFEISRSEEMVSTLTSEVRENLKEVVGGIASKAKTLGAYMSDVENLALDSETVADEVLDLVKEAKSKQGALEKQFGRLERVESLVRRIIDKAVRDKKGYLVQLQRSSQAIQRSLTRLKAKKIDPFGGGIFADAEKSIEEMAFKHLDDYRDAITKWNEINAPFTRADAGDTLWLFGNAAIGGLSQLPTDLYQISIPSAASYEGRGNRALALFSAAATTAYRNVFDKWSSDYYERVEQHLIDEEDQTSLDLGAARIDYEEAQDALAEKLSLRRAQIQEAHEKELARLDEELSDKANELYGIIREITDLEVDLTSDEESARDEAADEIDRLTSDRDRLDDEVTTLQDSYQLQVKSLPLLLEREEEARWYLEEKSEIDEKYQELISGLERQLEEIRTEKGKVD